MVSRGGLDTAILLCTRSGPSPWRTWKKLTVPPMYVAAVADTHLAAMVEGRDRVWDTVAKASKAPINEPTAPNP